MNDILGMLDGVVAEWFSSKFSRLTEPQEYAIPLIRERKNVLVCAPTGSGKTLTAFLMIINDLFLMAKGGNLKPGVRCVYVSPLKALANDIERNLNEPLREIRDLALKKGMNIPEIRVAVRTGDTPPSERQRQVSNPPHIFITTPESFFLVLTGKRSREMLKDAEYLIIDEIHDLSPSKRGVMLSVMMERLCDLVGRDVVRIGLSATQAPIEEIARFLGGYDREGRPRPVEIVDIPGQKSLDLRVLCPVDDLTKYAYDISNARMYDLLIDTISNHKTTLVFTNTRSGAESVAYKLRERGVEFIATHHGSLGREIRLDVEKALKEGELKAVVTSTSLELGIDIGHIEIVVQVGSPKSVAKGIQRVGRAGHNYGSTSYGLFIIFDPDDLIECAVLTKCAKEKKVDRIDIPRGSLDVLAQIIVSLSLEKRWRVDEMYALLKRSYSYHELEMDDLVCTLEYLSGRMFEDTLYGKIWYDPEKREVGRKRGGRMIFFLNMGIIPDEADYLVVDENKKVIGDLSEPFVERLEIGDVFVLGGRSYEFLGERKMRVYVRDALGKRPTVPSWTGEMLPRSFDLSVEIAKFRKEVGERLSRGECVFEWLKGEYLLDDGCARSIESYFMNQMKIMQFIPDIDVLCLEGYVDPAGNANIIFHYPFGRRVNDALSRAYAYRISEEFGCNVRISVTDNGFMLTVPRRIPLDKIPGLVNSERVAEILARAIRNTEMFKQRFRHCASRALMVLRNYKGYDISVAKQFLRSQKLLEMFHGMDNFPVLKETYREIMTIVMDLPHAREVLQWIEKNRCIIKIREYTSYPSPFAHNIILAGASDMILMEDRALLLKELHRQILARMFGDVKPYRFEAEKVKTYFLRKFGVIGSKGDILRILRRGGAFTFTAEKGKNIYRYAGTKKEEVRLWGDQLLAEGKISSCYTTEPQYVLPEDLPAYMAVYQRNFPLQDQEKGVLEVITTAGVISTSALREKMKLRYKELHETLRILEASYLIERVRVTEEEGVWWRRRNITPPDRGNALERVIRHTLASEGPLTADEIASRLRMDVTEIEGVLDSYVREGWVARDMFILGDRDQYMLSVDMIRLQEGAGEDVLDPVEFRGVVCARQFIPDVRSFFENMVFAEDAFEVAMHCSNFEMDEWRGMLLRGEVVYVKVGGNWRYMLAKDAHALSSTFLLSDEVQPLKERILNILRRHRWVTGSALCSYLGVSPSEGGDMISSLIERCILAKVPPELEEEIPDTFTLVEGNDEIRFEKVIERYCYGVPTTSGELALAFGLSTEDARNILEDLNSSGKIRKIRVLTEGGGVREVWISGAVEQKGDAPARILHPDDVYLKTIGVKMDGYALISGFGVAGSVDLWVHDDYVRITDVRCDDPKVFFDALEHSMRYFSSTGRKSVKIDAYRSSGWTRNTFIPEGFTLENGTIYYGMVPASVTEANLLSYVLERQRINALISPEEMLQALHGIRSVFELGLRMSGSRRYDPGSKFPRLYEGYDITGSKIFARMNEFTLLHAARRTGHLTSYDREVLHAIRSHPGMTEDEVYGVTGLGEGRFGESLRKLETQGYIVHGWKGRIFPVPEGGFTREDARKIAVSWLMQEYGVFTLDGILEYCQGEFKKGEMLRILNTMVDEGTLERFYIGNKLYYILGETHEMKKPEMEKRGNEDRQKVDLRAKLSRKRHTGMIVISPNDRLAMYLEPVIRERFRMKRCWVVIHDGEIIGGFRGRLSRSRLHLTDIAGGAGVERGVTAFARQWGLRIVRKDEKPLTPEGIDKEEDEMYEE